jgi:hypothetical protein
MTPAICQRRLVLKPQFYDDEAIEMQRVSEGKAYLEFLRVPVMSAGIYMLPRGGQ